MKIFKSKTKTSKESSLLKRGGSKVEGLEGVINTILAIFISILGHYANLLVKNIQNGYEIPLIFCVPVTAYEVVLRSKAVQDLLGELF